MNQFEARKVSSSIRRIHPMRCLRRRLRPVDVLEDRVRSLNPGRSTLPVEQLGLRAANGSRRPHSEGSPTALNNGHTIAESGSAVSGMTFLQRLVIQIAEVGNCTLDPEAHLFTTGESVTSLERPKESKRQWSV